MQQQTKFKQTEIGEIPQDWEVGNFNEDLTVKGRIGWRGYKTSDLRENGPIVLGGENIKSFFYIDFSNVKHLTVEKYKESPEIQLKPNDVLLVTRGNLGEISHFKGEFREVTINPSIVILRDFKGNTDFLFYYLTSKQGKASIDSIKSGSSVPAIYQSEVKKLKYPKPSIPEQQSIAAILSSLDTKIELNQQMSQTLEAIGQAVFKHWFVDFEFPNEQGKPYRSSGGEMVESEMGEIPKGWEVKPIDEIAVFLNGLALQKYPQEGEEFLPVIKIREMKQGVTESSDKASINVPSEYIIDNGDVLFSWSGSLDVCIWTHGKGALNQHLFKVTSSEYPKWLYYYWIIHYLSEFQGIAEDKATTMGHIKREHLTQSLVVVPQKKMLSKMNELLNPLFQQITVAGIEVEGLQKIRDSLLPKLMSGKIRVNAVR